MRRCWDVNPAGRPTFREIIGTLDALILEMSMSSPHAIGFWLNHFAEDALLEEVRWCDLEQKQFLQCMTPEQRTRLKVLFCVEWNDHRKRTSTVSMKHLDLLVRWFGNFLDPTCGATILGKMLSILDKEWFHWDVMTPMQAQRRLVGRSYRSFLVRVSFTDPARDPFVLSILDQHDHVDHLRVHAQDNAYYRYSIRGAGYFAEFDSLSKLVKHQLVQSPTNFLFLSLPCPREDPVTQYYQSSPITIEDHNMP
jgi:hypothetical protein